MAHYVVGPAGKEVGPAGKVEHEGPWARLWGPPGPCLVLTYHSPFPTPQTHALRL